MKTNEISQIIYFDCCHRLILTDNIFRYTILEDKWDLRSHWVTFYAISLPLAKKGIDYALGISIKQMNMTDEKLTRIAWQRHWWIQPQKNIAIPIHEFHRSFIRGPTNSHQSNSLSGIWNVWFFPLTINSATQFIANWKTSGANVQQSESGAAA